MAINVNTVYTTVLSILNKEQRGYITPDEFNKLATQVQLDIFENYFEDLNQQLRVPQTDNTYANRQKNIDNLISIFKTIGEMFITEEGSIVSFIVDNFGTQFTPGNYQGVQLISGENSSRFTVNSVDAVTGAITNLSLLRGGSNYITSSPVTLTSPGGGTDCTINITSVNLEDYFTGPDNVHRIGSVIYNSTKELQRVQRDELLHLNLSKYTKPTTTYPVYLYEQSTIGSNGANTGQPHIYVYPKNIYNSTNANALFKVSYIRKPNNVQWGFSVNQTLGNYIYDPTTSIQFELDATEQTEVILRILAYAGVVIRDPQIVQAAAQGVQAEEVNSKS
jgi:hypothetical protein